MARKKITRSGFPMTSHSVRRQRMSKGQALLERRTADYQRTIGKVGNQSAFTAPGRVKIK